MTDDVTRDPTPSHAGTPSCPIEQNGRADEVTREAVARATVTIDYTNWRGERSRRRIIPLQIAFAANEWHREPQWLLEARDLDKDEMRIFALASIHAWEPSPPVTIGEGGAEWMKTISTGSSVGSAEAKASWTIASRTRAFASIRHAARCDATYAAARVAGGQSLKSPPRQSPSERRGRMIPAPSNGQMLFAAFVVMGLPCLSIGILIGWWFL